MIPGMDQAPQPPRDHDRDRAWMELRAKSPLRRRDQADVNETPLFIAANEPRLPL